MIIARAEQVVYGSHRFFGMGACFRFFLPVSTAVARVGLLFLLVLSPHHLPVQAATGTESVPVVSIQAGTVPGTGDSLFHLGKKALSENRYKRSIEFFQQVAGGGSELYYWLGIAYWNRDQAAPAIQSYLRAIQLDTGNVSDWSLYALENLAEVYTRTDRLEESKKAYRQALQRETRPEWVLKIKNQLAELDLTMGQYNADTNTVFNERGEIVGGIGDSRMRTNRNFEVARHTNDPQKEERFYQLAIDTDPGMYQSPFNLGLALVHQGRYREAIPWLMKSDSVWKSDQAANPRRIDKADAHAFMALCYLESGVSDSAVVHAEASRMADGSNFWGTLYSQRVRIATGHALEALPVLKGLAVENPEHAEVLYALSLAYAAVGRREEAKTTLQAAIDAVPDRHPWMTWLRDRWKQALQQQGAQ